MSSFSFELVAEPWQEIRPPYRFYRLQIPAQGVPLTDDLEVYIFMQDGIQIGCINGHI